MKRLSGLCGLCVLVAGITPGAQPLDRLSGKVVSDRGEVIKDADVRVEALFGFAGGAYLGQRTFATKSDAKGGWALLGFKSGIWVFDACAAGQIPDAVALPFNLVTPSGTGLSGMGPSWHPVLRPTMVPDGDIGQMLVEAADAARAGRPERVVPILSRLSDSNDVNVLTAAGRICLVMRDATVRSEERRVGKAGRPRRARRAAKPTGRRR